MSRIEQKTLVFLVILCSIFPPLAYYLFSNVPSVSPNQAKDLLRESPASTVLLDVRDREEFVKFHIHASVNIPYEYILREKDRDERMDVIQGKTILVLCDAGIASVAVTRELWAENRKAFNIKGGIDAWIATEGITSTRFTSFKTGAGEDASFLFRVASPLEQWLAVLTGFGIKPAYTLLSLILVILLWKKKEIELQTLKYSMLFFFLGENFCAANYLIFNHGSFLFEYFHSLGMVICFGFAAYALLEGMDKYVFHYSDAQKKCALLGFCPQCNKYEDVPCPLKKCFIFMSLAAAVISLMPLCAALKMMSYNTEIWNTPYNYSHHMVYQLFEVRYCPILAGLAFASVSLILLLKKKDPLHLAKIVFAAACGPIGFSFFRFILFHGYQEDLVWMEFWEEITEFIFIASVAFVLWQFRQPLFGRK